jgi:hypothetical protein
MKALRILFTGWSAILAFLVSPTLAVLLSPHDGGEWKRWMFIAPWVVAYIWLTWPNGSTEAD